MKLKIRMYEVEWRIDKGRKKQMRSRWKKIENRNAEIFISGNKNEKKKKKSKKENQDNVTTKKKRGEERGGEGEERGS